MYRIVWYNENLIFNELIDPATNETGFLDMSSIKFGDFDELFYDSFLEASNKMQYWHVRSKKQVNDVFQVQFKCLLSEQWLPASSYNLKYTMASLIEDLKTT